MSAPPPQPSHDPAGQLVDVLFVLEQTLGNAVHAANLERELARTDWLTGRVVRLHWQTSWRQRLPIVGNWTVESSVRARAQVRRLLAERSPDAMYVHTAVPAALLVDVMRRIPTVLSTDATPRNLDTVADGYGHRVRAEAVEQTKQRITAGVYRAAHAVIAQSSWAADSLVRDYGVPRSRVHVLSQGADVDAFAAGDRPARAGRALRVLFVGRDFARKGGYVLLAAVTRLRGLVELDVVTGREAADELRRAGELSAGVRLHVDLVHGSPELLRLFHRADAFVLPTLADAAPLVLGEALAASLPVVGTALGAVPEMAVNGVTGLVVPPGSVGCIDTALRRLLDDDVRLAMGERARALALERYDARANNSRVLALLSEISGRSGRQAR